MNSPGPDTRSRDAAGLFWGLFGAAIAFNVWQLWSVRWLPLQDLGGHLVLMDVVARYGDPGTIYSELFVVSSGLRPNTLTLWLARWFGPLIGVSALAKLLLSAYVVGLPLSVLAVARGFGRSDWLAFFALPLTWNAMLMTGLINYVIAIPLLFWILPTARRFAEQGQRRAGVTLGAILVVLYFAHIIAVLIGLGMAVFVLALYLPERRHWRRLLAPGVVLPLIFWWTWRMFVALDPTDEGRTFGLGLDVGVGHVFAPMDALFSGLHVWGGRTLQTNEDEWMLGALGAVWLTLMMLAPLHARPLTPSGLLATVRELGLEVITLCCFAAYLCLPSELNEVEIVTERVVVQFWLLLALWPRQPLQGRARAWIAPVVCAALIYPWAMGQALADFDEHADMQGLEAMIDALPDGSRLAIEHRIDDMAIFHMHSLWHVPKAMHALRNGGITHESFASRPYTPVQFRAGRTPVAPDLEKGDGLDEYQYVLVASLVRPELPRAVLRFERQVGIWWLFGVR